jgi:hypothetical protein
MIMRWASPRSPLSPLQTKVTRSPMPRSAVPSRRAPMRAGEVLEDRDRPAGAARGVADALGHLGVLLGGSVAEVQPSDVHARLHHAGEHVALARGGADRGDDLRAALHRRRKLRDARAHAAATDAVRQRSSPPSNRGRANVNAAPFGDPRRTVASGLPACLTTWCTVEVRERRLGSFSGGR